VKVDDLYPRHLPDLFRGSQLLLTGRFAGMGPATLHLKGQVDGRPVEHAYDVKFEAGGDRTAFVPRLWAVRKVGFLMDNIRLNGANPELRDEIVHLGKRYGIVTPYTSYLVVEDDVAMAPGTGGGGRQQGAPDRRRGRDGDWGGFRTRYFDGDANPDHLEEAADEALGRLARARRPAGGGGGYTVPLGSGSGAPGAGESGGVTAPPGAKPTTTGVPANDPAAADGAPPAAPGEAPSREKRQLDAKDIGRWVRDDEQNRKLKEDARDALRKGYFTNAVTLSQELKGLRESRTGENGIGGALVRRVGDRTFFQRFGMDVESSILDLDGQELDRRLVRIEAFSEAWFALLKSRPELAKILALGDDILFRDGERVIQVIPAGVLKPAPGTEPAPGTPTPAKPVEQKPAAGTPAEGGGGR
jgi:Ca-activated chloride channel family protein